MDLFDINKLDEQMRREIDSVVNPRPSIDADDACVFVAAAAMSVGIPCRFVGVRYGSSWTCWLSFEVDSPPTASCTKPTPEPRWEMIDPLRQKKPDHEPDEQALRQRVAQLVAQGREAELEELMTSALGGDE